MTTRSGPSRDGEGGWNAIVAIADVSFYVRPGRELDREARARGNSVYFPDRVVPMLPEELSADICSLKAGEDRAAMACHLEDRQGRQRSKAGDFTRRRFVSPQTLPMRMRRPRSMRRTRNGSKSSSPVCFDAARSKGRFRNELVEKALKPCGAAGGRCFAARQKRDPLELDLPERRVMLDEKGRILSVAPRERLDAHRLVEDYMIAANVAAATALEAKKAPVMYRVHEPPSREKLVALKDYLEDLRHRVRARPGDQARRRSTASSSGSATADQAARRSWSRCCAPRCRRATAPSALGHFGLALAELRPFHLADPPLRRPAGPPLRWSAPTSSARAACRRTTTSSSTQIGEQISMLERRAMEAERETIDRYVAAFLADQVGQMVECRITGVQPFGFFATVEDLGGDGLVSASILGNEYFRYDEAARTLVGEETGETYRVGQQLSCGWPRPIRSSGVAALRASRRRATASGRAATACDRSSRRGRPANIRHSGRRR